MARSKVFDMLIHTVQWIYAFIILFPIYIVVTISLKSEKQLYADPIGLPKLFAWSNYTEAFAKVNMGTLFGNSALVMVAGVLLVLLLASLASFGMTRRRFRAGKALEKYFLIGMMIPTQVGMMPLYLLMVNAGLANSLHGLILLYIAFGLPFSTFILCSFFRSIPREIEEAAEIDGSGELSMYARVLMPLSRPALTTVIIFIAVWLWNDMFFPLLVLNRPTLFTVPMGLAQFSGEYLKAYNLMFAAVITASLPMIITYLFLQRQFIEGLTAGAVKG